MRIRFNARGLDDLLAQIDWLSQRSPNAARKAARRIRQQLQLLAVFPEAAPEAQDGQREAIVRFGRDGFVVRYRIERDVLLIVRVFHGRQSRHRQP